MEKETLDEALQLYLENYKAVEGELSVYVSHNKVETFSPESSDFTISFGKENVPVLNVNTVEEAGENVTCLCLVDVSGSLDEARMNEMKEILGHLTDNFKEGDSVCIVAMGDTLRTSGFLTDKAEIQEQIDALTVLKEDTNLYQGVTESLQTLMAGENVNAKRCLLVLSDGAEDNTYGITREEVDAAIKESHIPVYTVGMVKNTSNQAGLDSVKILGSFARVSEGGNHYVPKLDEMSTQEIATDIWNDLMNGLVIKADTTNLYVTGQELYLKVSVNKEGVGSAEAGMNAYDSNIVFETETEEIVEETIEEEPLEDTESQGGNGLIFLFVGIGLLLIIGAILTIILIRKKKKKGAKTAAVSELDIENDDADENADLFNLEENVPEDGMAVNPSAVNPVSYIMGGLDVRLIRMGIGETKTLSFQITDKVTMGRDKTKSDFALEEDNGLSSVHCMFLYQNQGLYLQDVNSTNGTYVNGVPIKTPIRLNQDDVILAGSYEYRICWQKRN